MRERIQTENAPAAIGPYSQAIKAGGFVFVSGQIAIDPKTGEFLSGGVGEQTERALKNLAAVLEASRLVPGLPLFAGGKSFGGRMTSQAQAASPLPGVRGLVFLGFPLHPPGKPSDERARHLFEVQVPMLFLQGTRDDLASLALLEPLSQRLARATLG